MKLVIAVVAMALSGVTAVAANGVATAAQPQMPEINAYLDSDAAAVAVELYFPMRFTGLFNVTLKYETETGRSITVNKRVDLDGRVGRPGPMTAYVRFVTGPVTIKSVTVDELGPVRTVAKTY